MNHARVQTCIVAQLMHNCTHAGRDIRAKLHSKKKSDVVFGTCITSTSPHLPAATRAIPGLDFVFIDTEHIPIGRETLAWMCRTYRCMNMKCWHTLSKKLCAH